jgi:mannose-1-phosphate guanylyltransferase
MSHKALHEVDKIKESKVIPVILCGGAGTRLWPVSREQYPKQFAPLVDDQSLFKQTVIRAGHGSLSSTKIIVSNQKHSFFIQKTMKELGIQDYTLVLEPCVRDTTAAIALGALCALDHDPEALILVMPSDHLIRNQEGFSQSVQKGVKKAEDGFFVTFGIQPTSPETGYGYVHFDKSSKEEAKPVFQFVEKPNKEKAKTFLETGDYFWNSGIFLFKAQGYLDAVKSLQPNIFQACQASVTHPMVGHRVDVGKGAFETSPAISVDYGIMEHYQKTAIVQLESDWSDLGSWDAVFDSHNVDANGNLFKGSVMASNVQNSYIRSGDRLVCVLDVDNLIVVDSPDALLITSRGSSQGVKKVVEALKADNNCLAQSHGYEERPWGEFKTIDRGDRFHVKRITVKPGEKLSMQMHYHRAEHWIIVSGTAKVTVGDVDQILSENQSIFIPCTATHRLENPGKVDLELIEVQVGPYLGEDDIVRFGDIYGRQ